MKFVADYWLLSWVYIDVEERISGKLRIACVLGKGMEVKEGEC